MEIKKFIKEVVLFIVFSSVFYVVILIGWFHIAPLPFLKKNAVYPLGGKGFNFSRMAEVDSIKDIDILFLGSSHAYRGFDTRMYREQYIKTFNLGSPSQSPIQTKILTEKYIKELNPKLVIYEVYPATFQNDGVESSLDIIANSSDINTLDMVFQINQIKVYNAFIIDLFRSFFKLNEDFKEGTQKANDTYVQGGFVSTSLKHNMSPITEKLKKKWNRDKWEIKDYQWEAFQSTLKLLKEEKINVWLVQTPVTSEAYSLYKNNDYIDSLFRTQGTYINFNSTLSLDNDLDFADYHHLNQKGVEKTNIALLELIRKNQPKFSE